MKFEKKSKRKIKISENEYVSLRAEVIQRIAIINTQTSTAIVTILTAWAAGISLSINLIRDIDISTVNYIVISFVRMMIFIIPVVYLIPLAIKSGENLRQLAALSAYIKVFHDCLLYQQGSLEIGWEIVNSMNSISVVDKGKKSMAMKFYNDEYTILAVFSGIFYAVFSCLFVKDILLVLGECYKIVVIGLNLCVGLILLAAIAFIHHASCIEKNLMELTNNNFEIYIQQAHNLGIYSKKEIKKIRQMMASERRR